MNMQTGFGDVNGEQMAEEYVKSMIDILLPVMEKGMLFAVEYSKACGRDVVLPEDMEYAIKYCAMYTVGQDIGTLFPDIYDEEESDEDDIEDVPDEDCPPFERYTGDDERFILMNQAYDRWESWIPQNPTERMLKNAINSNEHIGA
jgi:histone H3/H4